MTVLIAAGVRSPFTAVGGALAGWHPVDLAAAMMQAAIDAAAVDAAQVDEIYVGCAEPVGAQGADMARAAVLAAGWPDRIGGTVVDRGETSGMAAVHAGVAALESDAIRTAIVLGVCSATTVHPGASALSRTYGRPWGDGPATRVEDEGGLLPGPAAADRSAASAGIARTAMDEWAAGSHRRRALAGPAAIIGTGAKPGEGVAIPRGRPVTTDDARDKPDDAATLPPAFDPDGAVTGFSFAPPADGVTALVLTTVGREAAPLIVGTARSAGHPLDPLGGVQTAVAAALTSAGLTPADVDRWEIIEPTAAAALLAIQRLDLDPDLVNRAGGTLGVGDAAAAEELRLITDATALAAAGEVIAAVSYGPTGAAATILHFPHKIRSLNKMTAFPPE